MKYIIPVTVYIIVEISVDKNDEFYAEMRFHDMTFTSQRFSAEILAFEFARDEFPRMLGQYFLDTQRKGSCKDLFFTALPCSCSRLLPSP